MFIKANRAEGGSLLILWIKAIIHVLTIPKGSDWQSGII